MVMKFGGKILTCLVPRLQILERNLTLKNTEASFLDRFVDLSSLVWGGWGYFFFKVFSCFLVLLCFSSFCYLLPLSNSIDFLLLLRRILYLIFSPHCLLLNFSNFTFSILPFSTLSIFTSIKT